MKKLFVLLLPMLISTCCFSQHIAPHWVSDSLFQKPESVLYDSINNIAYVSNINGEYLAKDGNGFISKITIDGEIQELKWMDGLNNPQGLGLCNHKLYVADINRIVVINTTTAQIEHIYEVDSAQFFNDIAVDSNGDIYISDCFANKVYQISDGVIGLWLNDGFLSGPNGLFCDSNQVIILNMNDKTGYAVNKITKEYSQIFAGIDNLDGIVTDGSNGYFVSGAWQGQIFHIDAQGQKELILDLGRDKIITADIEYIADQNLLLVPTLNKTVIAYKLRAQ